MVTNVVTETSPENPAQRYLRESKARGLAESPSKDDTHAQSAQGSTGRLDDEPRSAEEERSVRRASEVHRDLFDKEGGRKKSRRNATKRN